MNMSNIIPIGILNKLKDEKLKKSNVRLAIEGDKEAFGILIKENLKSLYIVCRGILNSEYDMEDALQNTILKAYEKIPYLKNEEFFKT
ncbi:RNA polymerase sigma factor [Clostridium sp. HCS.1]